MDSQRNDIMSSYQPLIKSIKHFRGPDAYVLDTIAKVSSKKAKVPTDIKLSTLTDVAKFLQKIKLNQL